MQSFEEIPYALPLVAAFCVAFVVTVLMTPLARRIAAFLGAVDKPGPRRINRTPIPRMGGIGVFAGIVAALLLVSYGTHSLGWSLRLSVWHGSHIRPYWYLLSLGVMFLTGLIDDKYHLSPLQKLLGQTLAATIATLSGLRLSEVVAPSHDSLINLGVFAYPATIIFLVAYANVFNLIDGLDGLASGVACIASVTMFVISVMAGRMDAAAQALILAAATLAFLMYNFNPASIFLGDSGALLIGFMMGCTSLMSMSRVAGVTTIIIPLVISGIPIADTLSAIVRRKRANVSIGHADKGHLHHRLLDSGYDQRQAVLFIYAWTAFLCIGAITMTQIGIAQRIAVFFILIGMSTLMGIQLQLFRPILVHRDKDIRRDERMRRHAERRRSTKDDEQRASSEEAPEEAVPEDES